MPTFQAGAALIAWVPLVFVLFVVLPPRRAVIAAFVGGTLFLPVAGFAFEGLPSYNKTSATTIGVLACVLLFDPQRVLSFRFRWYDVPILTFSFAPMFSSLANGLGVYNGSSAVLNQSMTWLFPYFLGRIYFSDRHGMKELIVGVFIGGLLYMPLAWYELRMSPQLHRMVYGYNPRGWYELVRQSGYRPLIFFGSSLATSLWFTVSSLCGIWLAWTKAVPNVRGIPIRWMSLPLVCTALLIPSTGARLLLLGGLACLVWIRQFGSSLPILGIAAACSVYILLRSTGWDAAQTVEWAETLAGAERAGSWSFRLRNDEILADHARIQPVFGWGTWGRNRPEDIQTVTDTMWVIVFGTTGFVGLASWVATALTPPVLLRYRISPRNWARHPDAAAPVAAALTVCLWMLDSLSNAFPNVVFILCMGGLAGYRPLRRAAHADAATEPPRDSQRNETMSRSHVGSRIR